MRSGAIATAIWTASMALSGVALGLLATALNAPVPDAWGFRGFTAIFAVTFGSVGMLVARRHARHPVGWFLLAGGALSALQLFAEEYLIAGFITWPGLPAAGLVGWLNVWIWVPTVVVVAVLAVLYFPDGRLPSPAWWPMLPLTGAAAIVTVIGTVFAPQQLVTNMHGFPPPYDAREFGVLAATAGPMLAGSFAFVGALAVAAAWSVASRFRRAHGTERQQIKWFAYAAVILGAAFVVNAIAQTQYLTTGGPDLSKLPQVFLILAMALMPVSIGIAILRYRLYDVDLVINRTIVYAVVSAILIVTYVGAIVLLQTIMRPLTGGSEFAVAGSTLLVVALFQPIRSRVQGAVDRRFYRSRYDAGRTLDAFATRLRNEIDLTALEHEVLGVLDRTVRPVSASLWLRGRP